MSVFLILIVLALVLAVLSAVEGRVPLWIAVFLIALALLLQSVGV